MEAAGPGLLLQDFQPGLSEVASPGHGPPVPLVIHCDLPFGPCHQSQVRGADPVGRCPAVCGLHGARVPRPSRDRPAPQRGEHPVQPSAPLGSGWAWLPGGPLAVLLLGTRASLWGPCRGPCGVSSGPLSCRGLPVEGPPGAPPWVGLWEPRGVWPTLGAVTAGVKVLHPTHGQHSRGQGPEPALPQRGPLSSLRPCPLRRGRPHPASLDGAIRLHLHRPHLQSRMGSSCRGGPRSPPARSAAAPQAAASWRPGAAPPS